MSKNNSGLETFAKKCDSFIEAEIAELENQDIDIPQDYHEDMLGFIRAQDNKRKAKERKRRCQRFIRAAAIFLVAFVSLNAVAISTSEAYRERIMSLFKDDTGVILRTEDEYDLIGDWKNFWYPTNLPETYKLSLAEKVEDSFVMLYLDDENSIELRIKEYPVGQGLMFDTDYLAQENLKVGSYDGYIFIDKEHLLHYAVWMTEKDVIYMEFVGNVTTVEVRKIAEGMKFIKKI